MKIERTAVAVMAENILDVLNRFKICSLKELENLQRESYPVDDYTKDVVAFGFGENVYSIRYAVPGIEEENIESSVFMKIEIEKEKGRFYVVTRANEIVPGYSPLMQDRKGNYYQMIKRDFESIFDVRDELERLSKYAYKITSKREWMIR